MQYASIDVPRYVDGSFRHLQSDTITKIFIISERLAKRSGP